MWVNWGRARWFHSTVCVCLTLVCAHSELLHPSDRAAGQSGFSPQMLTRMLGSAHKGARTQTHTNPSPLTGIRSFPLLIALIKLQLVFSFLSFSSHFISFSMLPLFIISLRWSFFLAQKGCHGDKSKFDTDRRNELYSYGKAPVCVC